MKSKFKAAVAVGAATAAALAVVGAPPATAAIDSWAYAAYAGGTKITAIGTTVSSDLTAESSIYGKTPAEDSNKVATVKVSSLAQIGAVETDTKAEKFNDGFKTTSHARTANINLLNGLIKATAVETTAIAHSSSETTPSASSQTDLVGLTIAGKKYPINLPTNTGITIPGVASVVVNFSKTAVQDHSVVSQGAGLVVTLLKARNGVAAGAEIILNPTFSYIEPSTLENGGAQLGGMGFGAYVFAHVGDEIEAQTGHLGQKPMPGLGTNGVPLSNTTLKVSVPQVLNIEAIESTVEGTSTTAVSEAKVTSKLAGVRLFPGLLGGGLIQATAIAATAHTRLEGDTVLNQGDFQFVNLRIAGKAIPVDVGPNTTIDVAGLGTVTLNEHKSVRVAGFLTGYQVTALHIVLDTERAGLPIGAEIEVGVAQSLVWG